jgi:hypothetical protein
VTETALSRLLKYPHAAVFDVDAQPDLAFRLDHPDGAQWNVADNILTATAYGADHVYDLSLYTVGGLHDQLVADGFQIPYVSSNYLASSALALAEGAGNQGESNGDHINVFTSLLWALMSCYASETLAASAQVQQALRQMVIPQAEGEWLDVWGAIYGIQRTNGEGDSTYAPRIPREAFRVRSNRYAIEKAIFEETGYRVQILEPFSQALTWSVSKYDGPDAFFDGIRFGNYIIQPVANTTIDWTVVRAVIERNRAAGVITLGPLLTYSFDVAVDAPQAFFSMNRLETGIAFDDGSRALYGSQKYDDIVGFNAAIYMLRELTKTYLAEVPTASWADIGWSPYETWESTYLVSFAMTRDYREYSMSANYGANWDQAPGRTWATQGAWTQPASASILMTRSS